MSKSLFSVTPDPLTGGGIFSALQSLEPPWVEEDIALQLDMSYYGNISGGKCVSPLIDRILTASKLSSADMATLAGVIMAINKERWIREWATRSAEYDPIQNYNMTEEMTDDETVTEYGRSHTRTDNLAHTETRTDNLTRTIDNQEITTPNLTSTSQQATRGFNSNSDVNTDKETATNTGTNRVDTDGTEHNTGTQGTTGSNTGTQTDADTGSDTSTRNYTLTRSGNIGVTTSQQMLQSERDLWMWSYFYDVVFPDVDDVLTIPVYADGEDTDGSGGGIIPRGTLAIIENGLYDVTIYAKANVNVPLPSGAVNITTNGRHDVTSYEYADVLVPNSYTAADEGKVVSDGALVSQSGPLAVTSNGVADTTLYSSVNVNVQNVNETVYVPADADMSIGECVIICSYPDLDTRPPCFLPVAGFAGQNSSNAITALQYSGTANDVYKWTTIDNNFSDLWIAADYGEPVTVNAAIIAPRTWSGKRQIYTAIIEGSDDGTTWTYIGESSLIGNEFPQKKWHTFTIPQTTHRYYRLRTTTSSDGKVNGSATFTLTGLGFAHVTPDTEGVYPQFAKYKNAAGVWTL